MSPPNPVLRPEAEAGAGKMPLHHSLPPSCNLQVIGDQGECSILRIIFSKV